MDNARHIPAPNGISDSPQDFRQNGHGANKSHRTQKSLDNQAALAFEVGQDVPIGRTAGSFGTGDLGTGGTMVSQGVMQNKMVESGLINQCAI